MKSHPAWMVAEVPEAHRRSGFRASEAGVYLVVLYWRLSDLDVETEPAFEDWRSHRDAVEEDMCKASKRQHTIFMEQLLGLLSKHGSVFMHELVDLALDHPERRLGVAMASTLLAIYDGDGMRNQNWYPRHHRSTRGVIA